MAKTFWGNMYVLPIRPIGLVIRVIGRVIRVGTSLPHPSPIMSYVNSSSLFTASPHNTCAGPAQAEKITWRVIVFVAASICIRLLLNTKIINKQDVKLFDNCAKAQRGREATILHLHPLSPCKNFVKMPHATKITKQHQL